MILRGKHFRQKELESLYEKLGALLPLRGVIAYSKEARYRAGNDYLLQSLFDREIRISDRSFSQVNGAILPLLIETVRGWAGPTAEDRILELYSGAGTFTLFLAEGVEALTAVEENPAAAEDARWNLDRAGLRHVRLLSASAEDGLEKEARKKERYTKIFLDPPREGATEAVLKGMAHLAPEKIFYLSCNPATFARDIRFLSARGYRLARVQPLDMFPQTGHLELLAEAVRAQ
jgi:23S rRNA (uracil1939-C5)-methyltransferase